MTAFKKCITWKEGFRRIGKGTAFLIMPDRPFEGHERIVDVLFPVSFRGQRPLC